MTENVDTFNVFMDMMTKELNANDLLKYVYIYKYQPKGDVKHIFVVPFKKSCFFQFYDNHMLIYYDEQYIQFNKPYKNINYESIVNCIIFDLKKTFGNDQLELIHEIKELKEELLYSPNNIGRMQERIEQFQEKANMLN